MVPSDVTYGPATPAMRGEGAISVNLNCFFQGGLDIKYGGAVSKQVGEGAASSQSYATTGAQTWLQLK